MYKEETKKLDYLNSLLKKYEKHYLEYEKIKSDSILKLMSKDLHLSVHGMFYPYLELYTFWIYKGYLVERYSSCDWIYYFDKERRIRISEHILEHGNNKNEEKSYILMYFYYDKYVDVIGFYKGSSSINYVERIEKENGQLSRIISSSRHYKNEKFKDYDELIFKSNEVCAEWNTFTTREEIINGLKKCFFSDRKVKVIIGG